MNDADTSLSGMPKQDVVVLSRDVFFAMRIRNALKQMSYTTMLAKTEPEFAQMIRAEGEMPALVLIDFNQPVDWTEVSASLASVPNVRSVAFGPHADVSGFKAAREAGVTRVMANGTCSKQLPNVVESYSRKG